MPKIIKDLQPRIVETATRIFQEEGFSAVDIRRIAKESHIAVGTLYNYFPNKKALLYEVFQTLWAESIERLNRMIEESEASEELFSQYATAMRQEMLQKKGIGKHLFRLELMESNEEEVTAKPLFANTPLHRLQRAQMKKVLQKSYGFTEDQLPPETFEHLINTATMLVMVGESSNQVYLQFLRDLFGSYIRTCKTLAPSNS